MAACPVLFAVVSLASAACALEPGDPVPASAVSSVAVTVSDLDAAVSFYTGVLDFEQVAAAEAAGEGLERLTGVFGSRCLTAHLRLGDEHLVLTEFLAPEGRPMPSDSRSNDRWFQHAALVVSDMDRAYAHLRAHDVRHASSGPQTLPAWNAAAGGISAFYFKDPDGHVLEVIHFPPGKGDPKWQRGGDRLFLGIDHTAIVVADTDASVAFYQGALGMSVAGGSENHGPEQERLNNVFGARLRITTLRAPAGPGVELLEYLAPGDGRPYPSDSSASDLWHWHTTIAMPDPGYTASAARAQGGTWVSPGLEAGDAATHFDAAAAWGWLVRDPDGHAVLLTGTRKRPKASQPE